MSSRFDKAVKELVKRTVGEEAADMSRAPGGWGEAYGKAVKDIELWKAKALKKEQDQNTTEAIRIRYTGVVDGCEYALFILKKYFEG